jgi:hypothetical protein
MVASYAGTGGTLTPVPVPAITIYLPARSGIAPMG